MNLSVNVQEDSNVKVLEVSGEIDAYTAPELKETLMPLMRESGNEIEVDLENVQYMDSTGLGVFVSALKASKESGSHYTLKNVQDRVFRIFEITGLSEIIEIKAAIRGGNE
ncbi:anti-sigma-B factor antagonist [Oceanobacillus oncorhynchi subsp. incaldanensis]|uniref:Anti-sigma factor antagonist n=2 Tax=Oceanobacillus TaxID=182709 RepID=A0A0A1MS52_9BACI|nr:STAS domain-containing protein [Oceanobacillus oncorhynchi]GIO21327.1 anti-sigma-B factor antagonist [Oceanobacillus oncorhynchi subsp. incaldanensis]CEI82534.1 Anti-sigma-B factor antagonist [Oceanobacillus oncorhynchi]